RHTRCLSDWSSDVCSSDLWDAVPSPLPGHTTNPCGYGISAPCDDNGHGTHTTGITTGDDGLGNQIGVAPGASWIGCRNMDQGTRSEERRVGKGWGTWGTTD